MNTALLDDLPSPSSARDGAGQKRRPKAMGTPPTKAEEDTGEADTSRLLIRGKVEALCKNSATKKSTEASTRCHLLEYAAWLEAQGSLYVDQITELKNSEHRRHLRDDISPKTGRPRAQLSQRAATAKIRQFLGDLEGQGLIKHHIYYRYKLAANVKASVYMAQTDQMQTLLTLPGKYYDPDLNAGVKYVPLGLRRLYIARLRLILLMMISTGLRIGEVLSLQLDDYDQARQLLIVRSSKTGEPRDVPVSKLLADEIKDWLKVRPKRSPTQYLIVNETGGKLDRSACSRQYRRYTAWARAQGIELPRITMHSLRHVALNALASSNPEHARVIAGHKNMQTTLSYLHTTTDDVRATHAKADPLLAVLAVPIVPTPPTRPSRGRKLYAKNLKG